MLSSHVLPAAAMRRLGAVVCQGVLSIADTCLTFQTRNASQMVIGQPAHETHPELLGPDELLPGVTINEFQQRRGALSALMPAGAVAIVPAASTNYMAGIIPHTYRQDADFLWLTGLNQQAVAVITSSNTQGSTEHNFMLFIPRNDPVKQRWDGSTLDLEAAKEVFGADRVEYTDQLPTLLHPMAMEASFVVADWERPHMLLRQQLTTVMRPVAERGKLMALRHFLDRLRWRKSESEVALMKHAASIAVSGLKRCMGLSVPGAHEAQLAAMFEYHCKMAGAARLSYPCVVAGGASSCTVHYLRNDKRVKDGELLLMDAGCELHGYASDVTRTWPINGRFRGAQLDVYEVVLAAHQACMQACAPGTTLQRLHQLSVQVLALGLKDLGLFGDKSVEEIVAQGLYRDLYCHSVGHWLGMDTHDTPSVAHNRPLQPGVVLTIEPGLYIPDDERFGRLRGIGVRIEDDVLVTQWGREVLSGALPVQVTEVEQLVGALAST